MGMGRGSKKGSLRPIVVQPSVKRRGKLAIGVVLGALLFGVGRSALYLRRGGALVARASAFPREYAVGTGKTVRMLVLGDSTAAGVGVSRLEDTLPYRVALRLGGRVEVVNLAVSGATSLDVRRDQLAFGGGFDVALLSLSANDATHGVSPSDLEENLRAILTRLRGVPRVLLSTTPNFRTTVALPYLIDRLLEGRAATLTKTVRKVAAAYPNVRLAEINRDGALSPSELAEDGFHPNAAGYRVWARIFVQG